MNAGSSPVDWKLPLDLGLEWDVAIDTSQAMETGDPVSASSLDVAARSMVVLIERQRIGQ
jgi:hypothetical protein